MCKENGHLIDDCRSTQGNRFATDDGAVSKETAGFCYCFDALADRSRKIHFDTLRRDSLLLRQGGGVFLVENDNHTWLLWGWWSKC
jgi:hypothetical protein